MLSDTRNPGVVYKYMYLENESGGPMEIGDLPGAHISRFGVIEKPHQPGKYRLIVDLSHPEGQSVNDGIEPELCTLQYNIESAYRTVQVNPDDRQLLGMVWRDKLFIDAALPFGLRSAPKIFNTLADVMQWLLKWEGIDILHYLDDFLIVSSPDSLESNQAHQALEMCARMGVPIAAHKTEGPATITVFLGIELETVTRTLRLPEEKLARLQREIYK